MIKIGAALVLFATPLCALTQSADIRKIHGEFGFRLGPEWLERDSWSGPFPVYAFVKTGLSAQPSTISVEKYVRDNRLYPAPEDYLKGQNGKSRAADLLGRNLSKTQVEAGGRNRPLWERTHEGSDPVPLDLKIPSRKTRQAFVIIEVPGSYFVVKLTAPPSQYEGDLKDFKRFLRSFQLLSRKK